MSSVQQQLKKNKFFPSKKMGQNFLKDEQVISNICSSIPNLKNYDCIIEVGPGLGAITEYLVNTKKTVIAIELDKRLFFDLKNKFKNYSNLNLINDDFLEVNLNQLCNQYKNIVMIANIPYSITTPIVLKSLNFNKIKTLYIMVQKEVADKWVFSKPSNRNAATNIINYYYNVQKKLIIKNTSFFPIPKVDSAMILLDRKTNEKYDPKFYQFIRPFFFSKRKKMLNNLPVDISKEQIIDCIKDLGYDENVRVENLAYLDWKKIYNLFNK